MAKVWATPDAVGEPPTASSFAESRDWAAYRDAEVAYVEKVRAWCREHGTGPLRGEIVRFGAGDGYAEYVIFKPSELIHLPVGDAWQIPDAHMRGLRAKDIAGLVKAERALEKLFPPVEAIR